MASLATIITSRAETVPIPVTTPADLEGTFMVIAATNDTDVNFVEDVQMVDALRARKPDLAEMTVGDDQHLAAVEAVQLRRGPDPVQVQQPA